MDMKLEVVVLPVADVDRAKDFYAGLGWRLDADFAGDRRLPGGAADPARLGVLGHLRRRGHRRPRRARLQGLQLVVDDIEAARAELVGRGVDVSEVFHDAGGVFHHAGTNGRVPGPDAGRHELRLVRLVQRSGRQRLAAPGDHRRGFPAADDADETMATTYDSAAELAPALRARRPRTAARDARPAQADANWPDWYAEYMVDEQAGRELPT